jgi:IclR family KDG regulon transcriptional repressor
VASDCRREDALTVSRSLERGLDVLQALAESTERNGARLTDLAAATSLDQATTRRMLESLITAGYCRQNGDTKRYFLSSKVLRLSDRYQAQLSIRDAAHETMLHLRRQFGETVHLGVREGLEVVYVDKLECDNPIALRSGVGQANPLHTTALGKAVLSTMPPGTVTELLNDTTFVARTARSIRSLEDLLVELAITAQRGYSIDDRENEDMVICVGAPIVDRAGNTIAAVSISGPSFRMDSRIAEIGAGVHEAGRRIGTEV